MIRALQDEMPCLRERFGVVRLALYGSFARGEQTEESDVDILVELSRPLGLEFVQLACYLEEKLGRRVDLATFDSLHRTSRKPYRQLVAESILEDLLDVETAAR
ncbi:MAG: nucleotidyltransferase family protein [Anaerolineae bacterium]|nr:nucleotidyltransferase family protein [Anaerolineae bacterium]